MNHLKLAFFYGLLFLCFSCSTGNQDKKDGSSLARLPNSDTASLKLDYIYPIPKVVLYGGGSFTYDSIRFTSSKYVFFSNSTHDTALIKLDGKLLYLIYDSIHSIQRYNDSITDAWKYNGLSMILRLKVLNKTGDEIHCIGTLELIKNKVTRKFKIHGGFED